jgi:acyl carrier protein
MTTDYYSKIKQVLSAHAELSLDVSTIDIDDDLFAAGMSSRATVGVMLGLESSFDIEFPDAMLRRDVFESIRAIGNALETLKN